MGTGTSSWLDTRSAGVLAHVSSLPGPYGIGNLGESARAFIDLLSEAKVRYWQICPLGPTGYGNSPYQTFSGQAGNPYFIDLDELVFAGLLEPADVAPLRALPAPQVDYGKLYELFWDVLARAHDRFKASGADRLPGMDPLSDFSEEHRSWLAPFAAFMALKGSYGGRPWSYWPEAFRAWSPDLLVRADPAVRRDAERHVFYQYVFFGQWRRLRAYAAERGVGVIGDVPIFVALDSADTWQNRSVFRLDRAGNPLAVAGVPPDYFSSKGQLWGNPLYDWDALRRTGYAWWLERLKAAFALYDIVRLDHFRGFETYWEVPAGAPDASVGKWSKGPGLDFFEAVRAAIPGARIIAEDLGYIGPAVVALRDAAGLPGMKILQFAYGHDGDNVNIPHLYHPDTVVYTGTHDNLTSRGWLEALDDAHRERVDEYFQLGGSRSAWPMVRAAMATVSRLAVIPVQDLLDLPAYATLNRPGTAEGNWQWRFTAEQLAGLRGEPAARLRRWIEVFDRGGDRLVRNYSEAPEAVAAHA
jgi:4-alpha-glucanotransferase